MIYMEENFGTKLRCDCRLGQSREMLQVAKEKSKNIVSIVIRISEVSEWQVNDSVSDCRSSYEGPGSRDKLSLACLLSNLTLRWTQGMSKYKISHSGVWTTFGSIKDHVTLTPSLQFANSMEGYWPSRCP